MIVVATLVFIVAFLTIAITIPLAHREANVGKKCHDEVERYLLENSESYREYYEIHSPYWK